MSVSYTHLDVYKRQVKELSVMDITRFASRHWIFAPPATVVTNSKYTRTNCWLTTNYHGLRWGEGETPYDNLVSVLTTYTNIYKYVFVKGLEKKRFLESKIIHYHIINLDDIGCPKDIPYLFPGTLCLTCLLYTSRCV